MVEAQKLTRDDIQSKIESATYLNPVGTLTIAILTLTNGYTVTGESACLNPADFNADIGKIIAHKNAEEKIWLLEGYLRKEIAYRGSEPLVLNTPAPPEIPTDTTNITIPEIAVPTHDDLTSFLGVKIVNAKPMTRGVYNQFRGWALPPDENGDGAGYLVEYTDQQRSNVVGFEGYVSWLPKDVFDAAYHPYSVDLGSADPNANTAPSSTIDSGAISTS